MSENKIKALEEKGEKLESNIDSNREQINANLEAICWIRKLVLKLNKQKIFFWQLKKEISELEKRYESHSHPQIEKKISELKEVIKLLMDNDMILAKAGNENREALRILNDALKMGEYLPSIITYKLADILRNKEKHDQKDGEIDVEEMSNKNLCWEESNNDILPSSKPSDISPELDFSESIKFFKTLKKEKEPTSSKHQKDSITLRNKWNMYNIEVEIGIDEDGEETINFYDKDSGDKTKIRFLCTNKEFLKNVYNFVFKKEPTDDLEHEHQYNFNYDCVECGKNLLEIIERGFLTTEFDSHNTHKIVQKATLEGWKSKVQNYTSDNSIDSYNRLFSIIQEIDQYLGESEKE